mgnify:CR=1 FL=1
MREVWRSVAQQRACGLWQAGGATAGCSRWLQQNLLTPHQGLSD